MVALAIAFALTHSYFCFCLVAHNISINSEFICVGVSLEVTTVMISVPLIENLGFIYYSFFIGSVTGHNWFHSLYGETD